MVYAFSIGLFLGIPFGCYLREKGYAGKMKKAYEVFYPSPNESQEAKLRPKTQEFYDNLAKGQVEHSDFERYIYGGSYNQRSRDERDNIENEIRNSLSRNK